MSSEERDRVVLEKMIQYCDEAAECVSRCGGTMEGFMNDKICRYAGAMCLMQVGELTKPLSDAAKRRMNTIEWHAVYGLRNIVAHAYATLDWNMIWSTIMTDLPTLKHVCEEYLNN